MEFPPVMPICLFGAADNSGARFPFTGRRAALTLLLLAVSLAGSAELFCQTTSYIGGVKTRSLISGPVDDTKLLVLGGNTNPHATAKNDRGAVEGSFPLDHMQLVLQRPTEVEQELEALMAEQQDKGSPQYHKWLTASEFGARFGVSASDVERITSWLTSQGFRVDSVIPSGMAIEFSGTVGQVERAFHTEIHHLDVNGMSHISNMSDPSIPAALAGVVKGVHSLNDFMPHNMMKKKATYSEGGGMYALVPADLATIYNLNPLFNEGYTGSGQTVVVIEDTDVYSANDISTFRSTFGLSHYSGTFTQAHPTGSATCTDPGAVPGNESEATLDAEWAGASAPNAKVELASCSDTSTVFGGLLALQNLVGGSSVPQVVSISYGECETENGATANASFYNTYQQAAAEGISVFVSAGDEGAASCDAQQSDANHGIGTSGFATTPYNVAVGGTDFADTYENDNSTYWASANSSTYGSALSYVPEIPWNDSCASQLLATSNGFSQTYGSSGFCNSVTGLTYLTTTSGSGGPSGCYSGAPAEAGVVGGTCKGQPKPSWQAVLGNPADSVRDIPDVSLFAANGVWNHYYVYCDSDIADDGATCTGDPSGWSGGGGTSFASPILAGIQAVNNEGHATDGWGNPNPRFYALGRLEFGTSGSSNCNSNKTGGPGSGCVFYDVTLGDMDVNCTGTVNCYTPSGSYGVLSTSNTAYHAAYGAQSGWDFATGLGTINAFNLFQDWVSIPTTVTVVSSANPSIAGQPVTFTATINAGIGNPTGTVTWSSYIACPTSTIGGGVTTATCTITPPSATEAEVGASYSGDSNFSPSSAYVIQYVNQLTTMTTPAPGSTLSGSSVTFTWVAGTDAASYLIHAGTTGPGSYNVTNTGSLHSTSTTITGIPTTGGTLYVRLYSYINGAYQYTDYTYAEATNTPAAMTTPSPGSTLSNSSATFTWTAGVGVEEYLLHAGTAGVGSTNIASSGALTTTSYTVKGIPTTQQTLYVRLYSLIDHAWQYTDYTYTETGAPAQAVMTSPAPGSTLLTGTSATFTWTPGSQVSQYSLHVGTTGVGSYNIAAPGSLATTSYTVTGIPVNGTTLYVRLYSLIADTWQYTDYTYAESIPSAVMITPAQGSTLSGSSTTFTWTAGTGVTQYLLHVGTTGAGSYNVDDTGGLTTTSTTISGIPTTGATLYVRLYSLIKGVWQSNDYMYTEAP